MRQEFAAVYEELTRAYAKVPPARWTETSRSLAPAYSPERALEMVENAIRRAVRDLNLRKRVRPDARHFLLVTMHQMIALPILTEAAGAKRPHILDADTEPPDRITGGYDRKQLRSDVEHDVRLILESAARGTEAQLTARSIMAAATLLYEQLKTAASNAWG